MHQRFCMRKDEGISEEPFKESEQVLSQHLDLDTLPSP